MGVGESGQGGLHAILEVLDRLLSKPLPEQWGKWKLDRARRVIYYDGPSRLLVLARANEQFH